ncbi:DUF1850 domain-containing protein [Heyndrickxia sp. NPDC080065]|uniref:DUF1850 domain-containing protein n=1 Tax=Heyndrickxia sp. NPDC080065 TaxID=3390568 RepID=UPI003D05A63F
MLVRKKYLYLFLAALLIIIIFMIPFQRSIVCQKMHSTEILAYLPIIKNETFQIQYTHSIHLSEVKESYKILKNNSIKQIELMYDDTSIGMPSEAEKGEVFVQENGHYYIKNMNRVFPSFNLSTGQVVANHRLIYKSKVYSFKNFIKPGTFITIQVKKLSLFQLLKGVNIVDTGTT